MNADLVVADGSEWCPEQLVDGVLLDVPCTATGTASKRPDVLRRSPDCSELLEIQSKLALHAAVNIVKPGGSMVYATCSALKRESEDQVQKLLSDKELNLETIASSAFCFFVLRSSLSSAMVPLLWNQCNPPPR